MQDHKYQTNLQMIKDIQECHQGFLDETILLHKMHTFMLNLSLDKIFQEKNEKFFVSTSVLYLIEFFLFFASQTLLK